MIDLPNLTLIPMILLPPKPCRKLVFLSKTTFIPMIYLKKMVYTYDLPPFSNCLPFVLGFFFSFFFFLGSSPLCLLFFSLFFSRFFSLCFFLFLFLRKEEKERKEGKQGTKERTERKERKERKKGKKEKEKGKGEGKKGPKPWKTRLFFLWAV